MSGGADIEANVGLEVDSDPVNRAMDALLSRMGEIQAQVDKITTKARLASEQFGGTGLKTLQDFNKVIATLERFQNTIQKNDPQFAKSQEMDKAWAAREAQQLATAEKVAAQEAALWRKNDQERYDRELAFMKEEEKQGEKMIAQLNQQQLKAEAEVQRVREQNRFKLLRDQSQQIAKQAEGIRELEALQVQSAARIAELRGITRTGDPEQVRTALQLLEIEKQQLSTVTARIAEEQKAAISPVANRVSGQMDTRAAKLDETSNLVGASLVQAQERALELEARIAVNTERAHAATEAERLEIEKMLVLDKERLSVADRQVASLQRQAEKASQPTPGTSLLGKNGIAGVFAFSAAYGAAASVIYGVISTIKSGLDEAIKYQDTLEKIAAVAGLTNGQLVDLDKTIQDVAENSKFARQEIAEATTTLAQAGYSANDIKQALGAIAQLAASSGSSFAEATDVVTSAIGAFQLNAGDAERIANSLSAALNLTKLNIQQVAAGIQYAGATAYENNMTFEDLTATMAALAQAGIKSGSTMGTGVRQLLALLISPTKKFNDELKSLGVNMDQINVKTLGLGGVLENLTKAGFTAADAYKAMGTRGAAVYLALRNQQDVMVKVAEAQALQTAAATGNEKAMSSLSAQWQRFKNSVNDGTTNGIKPATDMLASFLKMINDGGNDGHLQELQDNIAKAMQASDGKSTEQVVAARDALREYREEKQQVIAVEDAHAKAEEEVETALNKASEAVDHEKQVLGSVDDALLRVSVRKEVLTKDSAALAAETLNLEGRFAGLAAQLQGVALTYDNVTKALLRYRMAQLQQTSLQSVSEVNAAQSSVGEFASKGRDTLHNLHQQGWFSSLPANVQKAIETARSGTGTDRAQSVILIQNYAQNTPGLAPGRAAMLNQYAVSTANLGLAMGKRDSAVLDRDTANKLMSGPYTDLYQQILTTSSSSGLQGIINNLSGKLKNAKGADQNALMSLLQQAASKQSLVQPPQPQTGKGRTPHSIVPRQDRAFDAESLKVDEMTLRNAIKDLLKTGGSSEDLTITKDRTLSTGQMKTNLEAVSDDLDQWEQDRRKQFEDELKKLKLEPNSGKGAEMQKLLDDEIKQKRQQVAQQVGAEITKALQKMVDAVSEVAKMATDAAQHELNMAQARVTALSRQSYQTGGVGVPDYIQQSYERRAAQAKDQADQSQISINQTKIGGLQNAFDKGAAFLDMAQMFGLDDNAGDQAAEKALRDLHDQIVELTRANDELKASFQGGLIPQSLNEKLQIAVENYKQVNHLQASWTDMVAGDFTNALSTSQNALQSFFQDIISGNASVGQSFGNMAKAAIGYLSQLLAKMIAVKLMDAALNLFGSAWSGMTSAGISQGTDFSNLGAGTDFGTAWSGAGMNFQLHGGLIHALTGRYVTDGVPNRDSVPAMIAKGEYVVQKSAVDSVGVGFMEKLNKQGANALGAFAPKVVLPPPAHQQMSVFIVPPEQQPQMGPNDVLVTIADDIWRGGQTKQLIKQVAQGA